ncbi:hypothetical protein HQ520_05200, partial [bacterium]|nr:hypothetical protein [bacterium]
SCPEMGATVLSVESQAKSTFAIVLAPLAGLLVDWQRTVLGPGGVRAFWPIAAFGIIASVLVLATSKRPVRVQVTERAR